MPHKEKELKKFNLKKLGYLLAVIASAFLIIVETGFYSGAIGFSPSNSIVKLFGIPAADTKSEFIEFCDVGQGDCTIIKSGERCAVIDFGPADDADSLYWHLKELGIAGIDFALVTHYHEDHLGGLCDIIERMPVENIIISEDFAEDCDRDTADRFYELVETNNPKIIRPEIGMKISVGNAQLEALFQSTLAKEENNRSIAFKLKFYNTAVLFTGDAESEAEEALINSGADITADILKLGHHGSSTSTGEKLLKAVNPFVAVASCGYNNYYNHPSQEVLERLCAESIKYYRTDLDGNIKVSFSKTDIYITTERQEKN